MEFYVYEWFNKDNDEIFYVGKGCNNRYKQTLKRNLLFRTYLHNNNCDCRIIKIFNNEEDAFSFERCRIKELRKIGQCSCNIDDGGHGGCNFVWTDKMRKYKSQFNPMKNKNQRERMKINNPMKNKDTINKVKSKISKKVILGDKVYDSIKELAKEYKIRDTAIQYWIKRGYGRNNEPCYYFGQKQPKVVIKTHETSNKPVIIDGIIFKNVKSGAKYIGVWSENLIRALKNNKKCKGHNCEYVNQQPSHENSEYSIVEGSTTNK